MGACLALFRRKTKEEDVESLNSLLHKNKNRNSTLFEVELNQLDTKPKHKTSDCDENLVEMFDNDGFLEHRQNAQIKLDSRRIKFANVEVRQYKRVMDYHPCISSGVPLGLDWEFEADAICTLDEYENGRQAEGRIERQQYACVGRLDPRLRLALALRSGHNVEEIEDMVDQVSLARQARARAAAERKNHAQKSLLQWLNINGRSKSNNALGGLSNLFSGWPQGK